jgi:hypothetical protein
MLAIQKQPKYLRKIVSLPNGASALVVFELIEINGKTTAKAIYGKVLKHAVAKKEEILSLPVYFERKSVLPIISPFFAEIQNLFKNLSFVTAQPTRAPNFI